ncbi:hypothetical protein C0389_03985 [bacterium]|nr:hypothetical protein [bacterium]
MFKRKRKEFHQYFYAITIAFLLFHCSGKISAQDYGTLRGLVVDSTSSEALSFSSAYIKELQLGANTDMRGYFLITSVPANKNFTLIVSYIGYRTKTMTIRVTKEKLSHYNIKLVPSDIQMKVIETTGSRITGTSDTKISVDRISAKQLEIAPKGVESDVFRTIKYLPGVTATSDVSARYYVRGGNSNQNLVLVDGITIYNPFHALGLFSVVDPDIVNSIEFFKGGFGAQFGGRLSSVMNIITKDGNKNNYSSKASVSLLSGKFLLEGPIGRGSFIIAGRKSLSNQITKKFLNEESVPIDFYDFSFKANYNEPDFLPGSKFSIIGFGSSDNIKNTDPQIEDHTWSTKAFGFKWFQASDAPLFFELGLSVSNFTGQTIPKFSSKTPLENKVSDIGLQMDFTYMFDNRDEINVGFHIKQLATDLKFISAAGSEVNSNVSGADIILYAKYKLAQWEFLKLDFGTRLNLTTLSRNTSKKSLEPRLNLSFTPFSNFTIKSSFGLFQQELTTIGDENEVINIFEPWIVVPDYLPPTASTHYIIGFDYEPFVTSHVGLELYYKKTDNVPLLNQQKISVDDRDFIAADAESYGLESSIKIGIESLTITTSYTLAYAYRTLSGLRSYPKYDIRHNFNLSFDLDLGSGWNTGMVWTYNSGLPFTQIVGFYDKYYFDHFFSGWDTDPRQPYGILGVQNINRLPTYHRLDFTISKKLRLDPFNFDISFSILNVYNRQNIFYFKRDTGERVNMLPFLPSATIRVEL